MCKKRFTALLMVCVLFPISCQKTTTREQKAQREITDSMKRTVKIPDTIHHLICSGPGCLRLLSYFGEVDKIAAVDDIEKRKPRFEARPYAIAHPELKKLPLFGEFRGFDNPELILNLSPAPDIIFKTYPEFGHDPVELQKKTGIPVITLHYGDLGLNRDILYNSLKIIGKTLKKEAKAQEIINYINSTLKDLSKRTKNIPSSKKKTCYIGGVAYKGPHGFQSTEPAYPPFHMVNADNVAFSDFQKKKELRHANIVKEKLIQWNPEIIFLDLSTIQLKSRGNAIYELKNDPVYKELKAVKAGNVYGVLPYNWYSQNFASILANAYYIGKVLYPRNFLDIDPVKQANSIYTYFVGKAVYSNINKAFNNKVFKKINLKE